MPQTTAHLPQAYNTLQGYINNADSGFTDLNPELKDSVFLFYNQIKTLFAQQGWLRQGGLIANYHAAGTPISQERLIIEALQVDKTTRRFTLQILSEAIDKIVLLLYATPQIPRHLKILLKKILPLVENTKNNALHQKRLYEFLDDPLYHHAHKLKIAFIPSTQISDPIRESKNEGHCYGHVMMWRNYIMHNQTEFNLLFRTSSISYANQMNQVQDTQFSVQTQSVRTAIQEAINKITDDKILYGLRIEYFIIDIDSVNYTVHIMGIRRIPNGCYEFFDPNYGIFVFQNTLQLEQWLPKLINNYVRDPQKRFVLSLDKLGVQQKITASIIPELKNEKEVKAIIASRALARKKDQVLAEDKAERKPVMKYTFFQARNTSLKNFHLKEKGEKNNILVANAEALSEGNSHYRQNFYKHKQIKLYQYFLQHKLLRAQQDALLNSITEENQELKNVAISDINREITRLERKWFGRQKEINLRINALRELSNDIINATPEQTLPGVIDRWLDSKFIFSSDTGRTLISSNHTKFFINSLAEKREISPLYLNFLRARVVEQLREVIFERDWRCNEEKNEPPLLLSSLVNIYKQFKDGHLTLRTLLIRAKEMVSTAEIEKSIKLSHIQLKPLLKKLQNILRNTECDKGDQLKLDNRFLRQLLEDDSLPTFNVTHRSNLSRTN